MIVFSIKSWWLQDQPASLRCCCRRLWLWLIELEVDDFVAELELELFLGWLKQMSGWTRPHKLNRLTWFQLIFLAIVLYMMDQRVNSLSSESSREKERIKICNIIVFDQLSLCAQWVHLDKKNYILTKCKIMYCL